MNITDYVANQTIRIAEAFADFISSTEEDRLLWKIEVENGTQTRSIFELVGECVGVNRGFVTLLKGEKLNTPTGGWQHITVENSQKAKQLLLESATELANAIRSLSPEDLEKTFQHPRGPVLGENFILMPCRNMTYHAGQINFIQTLYGDSVFHFPPNWL